MRDPTAHSGSQHDDVKDDEPHGVDACKYCAGHYRDVVTVFSCSVCTGHWGQGQGRGQGDDHRGEEGGRETEVIESSP